MNSLKPLVLLIILGGVGFGVYRSLTRRADEPPPGTDLSVTSAPQIKLGDVGARAGKSADAAGPNLLRPEAAGAPAFNRGAAASGAAAEIAPPFSAQASRTDPAEASPAIGSAIPGNPLGAAYATTNLGSSPTADSGERSAAATTTGAPVGQVAGIRAESFTAAWAAIQPNLTGGQLATALKDLTAWHSHPSLTVAEREMVDRLLGQLAGTVIYSREHLMAAPHRVLAGERLEDIAARYRVTPELLAKINELDPAALLQPGHELKVLPGPFTAIVEVGADRLTLLLDGCYAGSFALADLGNAVTTKVQTGTPVELSVSQKTTSPIYNSPRGEVETGDPANPLGQHLLALDSELAIHGTNPSASPQTAQPAAGIRMNAADIADVYDILTVGSRVIVRK